MSDLVENPEDRGSYIISCFLISILILHESGNVSMIKETIHKKLQNFFSYLLIFLISISDINLLGKAIHFVLVIQYPFHKLQCPCAHYLIGIASHYILFYYENLSQHKSHSHSARRVICKSCMLIQRGLEKTK